MKRIMTLWVCISFLPTLVRSETFPIGSYIINMGVTPQTVANGMKPYGLVFEFLKTYQVPIKWVIAAGKVKDGTDFTYNSTNYKGGTFIISRAYANPTIKGRITYWKGQGVVIDTTTSSLTVNVTKTLTSVPLWTLNSINTTIAASFFTAAGIPTSFYNTVAPSALGKCNDIFIMPHADPTWATYGNLYNWNINYGGAIWAGCHAVSVMESLVNPSNGTQKMNFLSTTGLINYGLHANGTTPYDYFFNRGSYNSAPISARADDPVFQMMGTEDAAHTNGSEQVYIPASGGAWRSSVKMGCYDSTQSNVSSFPNGPAAITLYGRGFDLSSAGYVMYQSGHDISGTSAASVSAMRQFFNFSLMAMADKVPVITPSAIPTVLVARRTYTYTISASSPIGSNLSYQWSSGCGGTFSNPNSASTSFTPADVYSDTSCTIKCIVTDSCSRYSFISQPIAVYSVLPVNLVYFNGNLVNNEQDAELTWTTTSEENLSHFEILRSVNGNEFDKIGAIKANANSNQYTDYKYLDEGVNLLKNNTLFYKLNMVDATALYTSSEAIELNKTGSGDCIISLYPNPSNTLIHLEFNPSFCQGISLEILDAYGRKVYVNANPEMAGNCLLTLDVNNLLSGIYIINAMNAKGKVCSARFVKN